jgi:hypothetical protein
VLKTAKELKIAREAALQLTAIIEEVPETNVGPIGHEPCGPGSDLDFLLHFSINGKPQVLACEVKASGQPRYARNAIFQLRNYVAHEAEQASPVFIAPYLSKEVRQLCRTHQINYCDLQGNCRLALPGLFIERSVAEKPPSERRELKSLFRPKAARVLRFLLREPHRLVKLTEISREARVSIGQAHNVKEALIARDWGASNSDGFRLTEPDALLDTWREVYEPPEGSTLEFYTLLHGKVLETALRDAVAKANSDGHAVLASFTAAEWLAPFVRHPTSHLYADTAALLHLKNALELSPARVGANVRITVPTDEGVLLDTIEPVPGLLVTSPAQTYLDLSAAGERGREAADHLRLYCLQWPSS